MSATPTFLFGDLYAYLSNIYHYGGMSLGWYHTVVRWHHVEEGTFPENADFLVIFTVYTAYYNTL